MSDIQEEQKRLYKRAEENDKTLLDMKLLLEYYKNNNILEHYSSILGDNDGRLIMNKEVINNIENVNEKIYITTYKNYIELQDRINKAVELLLDKYVRGLLNDNEVNNIVKILKGDNK